MEEGATLARTLLPYLNRVTDYRFLTAEHHFITNRFLASLVTHISDTKLTIGVGFILFALELNPPYLKCILENKSNIDALRGALNLRRFPAAAVTVMCLYP